MIAWMLHSSEFAQHIRQVVPVVLLRLGLSCSCSLQAFKSTSPAGFLVADLAQRSCAEYSSGLVEDQGLRAGPSDILAVVGLVNRSHMSRHDGLVADRYPRNRVRECENGVQSRQGVLQ
jgi:hypothetical protein